MDGLCFGCATKFGFFTKEHSCHKCGHAYCKTCLPHKTSLPGKDPKKQHNVCTDCYKILHQPKSDKQNEGKYSPPENFKKRVAALHQKEQGKQSSAGQQGPSRKSDAPSGSQAAKYKNLAPQDRDIAIRLERLQEDRKKKEKPALPQSEIEERLRKLQGLQPSSETTKQTVLPQPEKTMEEQYDDLLDQMTEEVALDARLEGNDVTPNDPAAARSASSGFQPGPYADPLLPSEEDLKQLTEDAKKLMGGSSSNTEQPSGDNDHRPPGGRGRDEGDEREARRLAEEANRMMEAARAELQLDEEATKRGAEKDADIAGRLAHLQGVQPVENTGNLDLNDDSDEDEEKASQRLIQQLLEEDKLDDRVAADGFQVPTGTKLQPKPTTNTISEKPHVDDLKYDPPRPQTDPDELAWCCICNEDAVLRCVDCDNDLYCKRCFREGHRDFGIESHKIKPYKAPNK
ncbi:abscission/NoCut checkpoint regulator isoform X1 [Strongylocentrotus purpuratus]|uniref:FYVE-type domain-containing protein n=1 Tax=Strongylocentrotus purpuratus TaxID=7668 RepID=A0A7M7HKL2_STRPU|nr:abscission/NoCut checkpoint regulator isoform X1 [Strongylocentrotus purpuratus]